MFKIFHAVDNYKYLKEPKTDKGYRSIVISSDLKDQLSEWINNLPDNQEFLFLNSVGRFFDLKRMTEELNRSCKKLNLKLPFRKNYFFRHWNASMWAASGKYTNAMDFANDMGDKDINMIEEKYIKKYSNSKNSEKFTEHQNNNYKWS
jgi:integrase